MCCLNYEYGFYEKTKRDLPKVGKKVTTKDGEGKVLRQNVLKESLDVMLDSGIEIEVKTKDLIMESFFSKNLIKLGYATLSLGYYAYEVNL